MGLTELQFWRMTPLNFERMKDGYYRRNRAAGIYFREMYALQCNINRTEKSELVLGTDVLQLPDDPPPPKIKRKARRMTPNRYKELFARFNGGAAPEPKENANISNEDYRHLHERFNPKTATA